MKDKKKEDREVSKTSCPRCGATAMKSVPLCMACYEELSKVDKDE